MNQIYRWVFVYSFIELQQILLQFTYFICWKILLHWYHSNLICRKKWFQRKLDCEYQILLSREVGGEDMLEQPLGRSRLSENLIVTNNSMKYWHRHKGVRDWVLSLKCYCFGDDTSSSADLYQLPKIKKISKYLQISASKY